MTRRWWWAPRAALVAVALTTGCDATGEGDPVALFPADAYSYGCENWSPKAPPAFWSAFDIPAWGTQKDSIADAITAMGGWTVAVFNAPNLRVVAPVAAIPALYDQGVVSHQLVTRNVADTLDRSFRFGVFFADTMTVDDIESVSLLGVSVVRVWPSLSGIVVVGHDSLLPIITAMPRVEAVDGGIAIPYCIWFPAPAGR